MKDLILLGASGSIGTQTLMSVKESDYNISVITIGHNLNQAINIINDFDIKYVSCIDEKDSIYLKNKFPNIEVGFGEEGILNAIRNYPGDVLNAITGIAGLRPTIEAIKLHKNVYLANKETMVVAGDIINDLAKKNNVKIIPIDSEHNAIYQLLQGIDKKDIKKLIITASGGAFRDKERSELENVTIGDALKHPNWSMGKKITVDCASMVNKGLEVMEAHHLFNMPYSKITTVIHKESIIHSMVEYTDNSVRAVMYNPSMIIPIQNALLGFTKKSLVEEIDFEKIGTLSFKKMDYERYPMIELAYYVGEKGGFYPVVYNAANEKAVGLFIEGKIKFLEIEKIIRKCVDDFEKSNYKEEFTIDNIISLDKMIKESIK